MPGQGPAPMHLDLAQGSQVAPWDRDLDLVPMEPPHHMVREKSHMWLLMHSVTRDDKISDIPKTFSIFVLQHIAHNSDSSTELSIAN